MTLLWIKKRAKRSAVKPISDYCGDGLGIMGT